MRPYLKLRKMTRDVSQCFLDSVLGTGEEKSQNFVLSSFTSTKQLANWPHLMEFFIWKVDLFKVYFSLSLFFSLLCFLIMQKNMETEFLKILFFIYRLLEAECTLGTGCFYSLPYEIEI